MSLCGARFFGSFAMTAVDVPAVFADSGPTFRPNIGRAPLSATPRPMSVP